MKKIIFGTAIGIAVGYLVKKLQEEGAINQLNDDLDALASKTKKKIKNILDVSKNEIEYGKERVEQIIDRGKKDIFDGN